MSYSKLLAAVILMSLTLSGCDLVTETRWLTEAGW